MENEISKDYIITIISEDEEVDVLIVDIIEYEEIRYILGFNIAELYTGELKILEEEEFDGDVDFYEVTDTEIKEKLFKIFEERNFEKSSSKK